MCLCEWITIRHKASHSLKGLPCCLSFAPVLAEVFGFHALRHKAASIVFVGAGLNAPQQLMGRSKATATDIYVRSAGLYSDQDLIGNALGESGIGKAANELLESEMPHDLDHHEAFSNQNLAANEVLKTKE